MRLLCIFLVCLLLLGCVNSRPFTDPKAYTIRESKQVTSIEGCTMNSCVTTFNDGSFSVIKLPLKVGDTIVFVWSEVAKRWFHYKQ